MIPIQARNSHTHPAASPAQVARGLAPAPRGAGTRKMNAPAGILMPDITGKSLWFPARSSEIQPPGHPATQAGAAS